MKRIFFWVGLLLLVMSAQAQVVDNFSDGDFTTNPTWTGDVAKFTVNASQELQSNGAAATETMYLSTPNSNFGDTEWRFKVRLGFSPSTANYVNIYLASDQANLNGSLNGYYIRIGATGTTDKLDLYRQDGTTSTLLAPGLQASVAVSPNVSVKVTRSAAGLWTVYSDLNNTGTYIVENSALDNTYSSTANFGFLVTHTATNTSNHFFDNVYIGAIVVDVTPPAISSTTVLSATELDVLFNEPVETLSAETLSNYSGNLGLGNPSTASKDATNPALVHLTFAGGFTGNVNYTLSVNGVKDLNNNTISTPITSNFTYLPPFTAAYKDVIINEILAAPASACGLPNAEYIELYNRSGVAIDLAGWKFRDPSTIGTLPSFILNNGEYLILTSTTNASLFSGNVVGVPSFPSLNNAGDNIGLRSNTGVLIDSVAYLDDWYNGQSATCRSLELVNPTLITCSGGGNWLASTNTNGGTPGIQNSVFNTTPDVTAPTLLSASATFQDTILLCFSEAINPATFSVNANYTIGTLGQPVFIAPVYPDLTCVKIVPSSLLTPNTVYNISVSGLADCSGNAMTSQSLPVTFVQAVLASYKDVIITEIFPDPTPQVGLPNYEYIELFNRSSKIIDLDSWQFTNGTTTGTLPNHILLPNEYVILTISTGVSAFTSFGTTLAPSSWPALTNGGDELVIRNANNDLIDSVAYNIAWYRDAVKDDGGWSLELKNPNQLTCPPDSNWIASTNAIGGTPGSQNSVYSTATDVTAPIIASASATSNNKISLCFNEPMNLATLQNANFSVNGGIGQPILVQTFGANGVCVDLTLANSLNSGQLYTLTISGASDCSGNIAPTLSTNVTWIPVSPGLYKDVILTEIFPDPTPQIGLPNYEYVELFNRGIYAVNLEDWTFSNGSTNGTLPNHILLPNEYVILTISTGVSAFTSFGTTLAPSSWPALTNGGDELVLKNVNGDLIDSVAYNIAWYKDAVKADGGWSLELKNPNQLTCPPDSNWIASTNAIGGTPGSQNSVYSTATDITAPIIASVIATANDTVKVCFNEPMNAATLANANFSINGIGQPSQVNILDGNVVCVELILSSNLIANQSYTLTISGASDCSGNVAASLSSNFTWIPVVPATYRDVMITEIMADPSPEVGQPNSEYIELYNRSANAISLENWNISNGSTDGYLPAYILAPNQYVLLVPSASVGLFSGISLISPSSWPSLTNGGDQIGLRSNTFVLIDSVNYNISWYQDGDKDDGGWSLELINPQSSGCPDVTNWMASIDGTGGTPAAQNSVYSTLPDVIAPTVASANVLSLDTLQVCFSESMNQSSISALSAYSLSGGITILEAIAQAPDYECVTLVLGQALTPGVNYQLSISNTSDCSGNSQGATIVKDLVKGLTPLPYQVVFTELYPDYSPSYGLPAGEFVEIYNNSNTVLDISNWSFTDGGTVADWGLEQLAPYQYAIICSETFAPLYANYGKVIAVSSFPSLNNDADSLYLQDADGVVMDYVFYSSEWYGDDAKIDGGYTLERVDPTFTDCNNAGNWTGSNAAIGGTPGTVNSANGAFIDTEKPTISGVQIQDPTTLVVYLSEPMNAGTLTTPSAYSISPSIGQPLVAVPIAANQTVLLLLSTPLDNEVLYNLHITGLNDCAGNTLNDSIYFGIPSVADSGDIQLNEILFNPYTGGYDFVEIYNKSDKVLDLSAIYLGKADYDTGIITDVQVASEQQRLLLPKQLLCLTENVAYQKLTYQPPLEANLLEVPNLPTYDDSKGDCILLYGNTIMDRFRYNQSFQYPTLHDKNGISLERISLSRRTQDSTNWHSAAFTVRYATPGYANSQRVELIGGDQSVSLQYETFTPNGDGDKDNLAINYDFNFTGANMHVSIFDSKGRVVRNFRNQLMSPEPGTIFWDGMDDKEQKCLMGIYIILFEVFDAQTGKQYIFKNACVLGDKM